MNSIVERRVVRGELCAPPWNRGERYSTYQSMVEGHHTLLLHSSLPVPIQGAELVVVGAADNGMPLVKRGIWLYISSSGSSWADLITHSFHIDLRHSVTKI